MPNPDKELTVSHDTQVKQEVPERIFVQLTAKGNPIPYVRDPREVHDNGQPVYEYHLGRNATKREAKTTVRVIEGRPRSKRPDYNAYGWRPVDHAVQSPTAKKRLKIHRESRPSWEFRMRLYGPLEERQ